MSEERKQLEQAMMLFYRIQLLQTLVINAGEGTDNRCSLVDYAYLLNEFIAKLGDTLNTLEKTLYTKSA